MQCKYSGAGIIIEFSWSLFLKLSTSYVYNIHVGVGSTQPVLHTSAVAIVLEYVFLWMGGGRWGFLLSGGGVGMVVP